jgi:hypothetical protein
MFRRARINRVFTVLGLLLVKTARISWATPLGVFPLRTIRLDGHDVTRVVEGQGTHAIDPPRGVAPVAVALHQTRRRAHEDVASGVDEYSDDVRIVRLPEYGAVVGRQLHERRPPGECVSVLIEGQEPYSSGVLRTQTTSPVAPSSLSARPGLVTSSCPRISTTACPSPSTSTARATPMPRSCPR